MNFSTMKIINIVKPHLKNESHEQGFPAVTSGSLPGSLTISWLQSTLLPLVWALAYGPEDAYSLYRNEEASKSNSGNMP